MRDDDLMMDLDDEALLEACLDRLERRADTIRRVRESEACLARTRDILGMPAGEPIPAMVDWAAVRMGSRR